jgi:uncharacterized protein (UPF0332 family)
MTDSKQDYINYRLDRSVELFQDAKLLAKNKRWRSCVNRLYYSSFHLVNALLFQDGITPKSHDGIKTKFFQFYIKTNRIDQEFGKLYSQLIDWRQESDYSIYVDFDEEDVKPLIKKVEKLNHLLTEIVATKI